MQHFTQLTILDRRLLPNATAMLIPAALAASDSTSESESTDASGYSEMTQIGFADDGEPIYTMTYTPPRHRCTCDACGSLSSESQSSVAEPVVVNAATPQPVTMGPMPEFVPTPPLESVAVPTSAPVESVETPSQSLNQEPVIYLGESFNAPVLSTPVAATPDAPENRQWSFDLPETADADEIVTEAEVTFVLTSSQPVVGFDFEDSLGETAAD